MIAFLSGVVILKREKYAIIEVNHIGYEVFLSRKTIEALPKLGEPVKVFCYHNVTETASDLYGFLTHEELDFFKTLLDIHGVGPKAALEISVLGPLEVIKDRILQQDEKLFAGIPGIGPKKAMTIILELTGKIRLLDGAKSKGSVDPAEDALLQLGFSKAQAKEALKSVSSEVASMEERVKIALQNLGK